MSDGAKAGYVFAAFVLISPLGLLLALIPDSVYNFYDGHWGLTALEDQQIGGVTMSSEAALVFFAVFAFFSRESCARARGFDLRPRAAAFRRQAVVNPR